MNAKKWSTDSEASTRLPFPLFAFSFPPLVACGIRRRLGILPLLFPFSPHSFACTSSLQDSPLELGSAPAARGDYTTVTRRYDMQGPPAKRAVKRWRSL